MSTVHHTWKSFELIEEDVLFPDNVQRAHTTLRHPGAAIIMAKNDENQFLILKQFRPSLNDWIIEFPAGTREDNESFFECAQRELPEETGYAAQEWYSLGPVYAAPGFCDEMLEIYVASCLSPNSASKDDDEFMEVLFADITTLKQWAVDGTLNDAKSLAALLRYQLIHG